MIEFLSRASSLHAMVVHFPLALSVVAIPLVYLCAAGRNDRNDIRWVAVACYVIVLVTSFLAVQSGHGAMDHIPSTLSPDVWATVERHEVMAEKVWIFAAATGALLVLSTLRIRTLRVAAATLAVVSSLLTAGWVGITGHYGGTLVYEYGVGTPAMDAPEVSLAPKSIPQPQPVPVVPPSPQEPAASAPVVPPAPAPEVPMTPAPDASAATPPAMAVPEPGNPATSEPVPAEPTPTEPAPVEPAPSLEPPAPDAVTPEVPGTEPSLPIPLETTPAETLSPAIRDFAIEEAKQVSYKRDIVPILELHCVECHNPDKAKGDMDVTSVESLLLPGKKAGPGVLPGKPDESSVVEYIRGAKRPQMPKGEEPISEQELHIIRMWIAAGAVDDSAAAPTPVAQTTEAVPAAPIQ